MKRVEEVKEGILFVANTLPYVMLEQPQFISVHDWGRHAYSIVLDLSTYVYRLTTCESIKEYKEKVKLSIFKTFYDEE